MAPQGYEQVSRYPWLVVDEAAKSICSVVPGKYTFSQLVHLMPTWMGILPSKKHSEKPACFRGKECGAGFSFWVLR